MVHIIAIQAFLNITVMGTGDNVSDEQKAKG